MTIHREGYRTILVVGALLVLINVVAFKFLCADYCWISTSLIAISIIFWLFIVSFFRIPNRKLTIDENAVVSPCDGKVVVMEEVFDEEYFKAKVLQVSIFMSPANVHVNRNPISGEVLYNLYHKGKYLVAWNPKSSTENERHSVVIKKEDKSILVKQIAGAVAKRIVNYLKVGEQVSQSQELGFIKFGSRVDLLLPLGTKLNVSLNEVVQGGVTIIATL
ncbi:MAG: phosphatidylserine decarboxylase family protein [Sphingobacteriales bacterium]|nr:phosphatidylserine decarboxylase family protein [Sphingobacteriales bacterium]